MGNKGFKASSSPPSPPPEAVVMDIVTGGWKAQALGAFVQSGLADVMPPSGGNEFAKPADLAKAVNPNLDANAVHRILRFLSTIDVCVEHSSGDLFQLGPVGEVCKTSHPKSAAGKVLLESSEAHMNLWRNMPLYLQTGKKVTKAAFGQDDYWAMCKSDPEHLGIFQQAMSSYSNDEATMMKLPPVAPTFDLSTFETVCDLGSAEGVLSIALAERFDTCSFILADLKEAVERIDVSSLPPKFEVKACHFLAKSTIPKADAYLLKHIIHDWDDPTSIAILSNVKSVNPSAKLFIMEFGPMPGPNVPHLTKLFDLHMAISVEGRERTQEEYNSIFDQSGYKLEKTHLLAGGNYPLYIQEIVTKE